MARFNQNNKIDSVLRTRNHQVESEKDPINITYDIFDQIFKVLDEEDTSAKQIITCFATLSKKVKMLLQTLSKKHNFVKKAKNYLKKPQMVLSNYIRISQKKAKQGMQSVRYVGVFYQNLSFTAYTSENYSNFENKSLFINAWQYSCNKVIIKIS